MGNILKETGCRYSKAKANQKVDFLWTNEKQSWTPDDRMKVTFSDESHIYAGQGGDMGTSVWCHSAEIHKGWRKHRVACQVNTHFQERLNNRLVLGLIVFRSIK